MCAKLLLSYPTLCDHMDCSLPGSSVHGTSQARILEWVAMLSSRGSSNPGIKPASLMSLALAGWFFITSATCEALRNPVQCSSVQSLSHVGLCDPMDCSPPGSSVHGILQAKILEWVAMLSSRGSSNPGIEPRSPAFPALQAYTHTHTHTHTHYMYIDISIYTHTYIHTHTHIIHK